MRIDESLLRHLEDLARLETDPGERAALCRDLTRFLGFAAELPPAPSPGSTEDTDAAAAESPRQAVSLRDDVVAPSLPVATTLANAPAHRSGCFSVPPVLPGDGPSRSARGRAPEREIRAEPPAPTGPTRDGSPLSRLTLAEALRGIERGAFTAAEFRADLRRRIARVNPRLNAYCHLPAEEDAPPARADGPLRGLPFALKDNLHRAGEPLGCASRILAGYRAPYDATATARLLAAGGAALGRTNMDEFGMGSSCEHSVHGPTRNPWRLDRSPGGSSGGAAAAVAAECALFALGSDTGGSLRQPAAHCGVVGVKPTYGRVSRYGLTAFASSLDQIGVIARDTRDAALALELIMGRDRRDATCLDLPPPALAPEAERSVRGLRIGVPRGLSASLNHAGVCASLIRSEEILRDGGARLTEVASPASDRSLAAYYLLANAEAASNLARFDGVRFGARAGGEADIETMYRRTRGAGFGPEVKRRILLGTFALASGYHDAHYLRALAERRRTAAAFARLWRDCDALLLPVAPGPAFPLGSRLDDPLAMYLEDLFTVPASLAGLPAGSVPAAVSEGLPLGVQVVAPPLEEATLIRVMAALERGFPVADARRAAVAAALAVEGAHDG